MDTVHWCKTLACFGRQLFYKVKSVQGELRLGTALRHYAAPKGIYVNDLGKGVCTFLY